MVPLAGIIHGMFVSGGALLVVYASGALPRKEEFRATMAAVWFFLGFFFTAAQVQSLLHGAWHPGRLPRHGRFYQALLFRYGKSDLCGGIPELCV